jgi:hypothetical protein
MELLVPSHPIIIQSKQPGGVNFELDTAQVGDCSRLLQLDCRPSADFSML